MFVFDCPGQMLAIYSLMMHMHFVTLYTREFVLILCISIGATAGVSCKYSIVLCSNCRHAMRWGNGHSRTTFLNSLNEVVVSSSSCIISCLFLRILISVNCS